MVTVRDPAARELLGGSPRRWPIVVGALASMLAVAGIPMAALSVGDRLGGSANPSAAPPLGAPEMLAEVPAASGAATQPLSLPQPTSYDGIVPVGYPRSVPGAIAAAYGYSRIATGLDVEATLGAVELIADRRSGWFARQHDSLADGLVEQRRGLGLSAVGPGQVAAVSITPSGYQTIGSSTGDAVTVLTLDIVSATATDGTRTSGVVVLRWALRWDGARWLATRMFSDTADDRLAVTPLTSQARELGWQVAQGG